MAKFVPALVASLALFALSGCVSDSGGEGAGQAAGVPPEPAQRQDVQEVSEPSEPTGPVTPAPQCSPAVPDC